MQNMYRFWVFSFFRSAVKLQAAANGNGKRDPGDNHDLSTNALRKAGRLTRLP